MTSTYARDAPKIYGFPVQRGYFGCYRVLGSVAGVSTEIEKSGSSVGKMFIST